MLETGLYFAQIVLLALYIITVALLIVDNYRTGGWLKNAMLTPFILLLSFGWPIVAALGIITMVFKGDLVPPERKAPEKLSGALCNCPGCSAIRQQELDAEAPQSDIDRD